MVTHIADDVIVAGGQPTGATVEAQRDCTQSVSVVICAYTVARWVDLCRAVESVLSQDGPIVQIILVIDHCDELYDATYGRFFDEKRVTIHQNVEDPGLSGARNTGVKAAHGDVVAFLDDDAIADSGWALALAAHYDNSGVACVGGYADPVWAEGRPAWLPREFDWVVGCSYAGQPTELADVRNPLGCNMSIRRSVIDAVGGFRSEVGRVGSTPVGGEETEMCIRIRSNRGPHQVLFDPQMRVRHYVSSDRATLRYFVRRCHHEGLSKAVVSELAAVPGALDAERVYTLRVLPLAVLREISSMSRDGLARAGVIVLGLAVTCAGYLRGSIGLRIADGRR
jgi:glycosyltransferase involved in cell wall biosynthesis